jgi:hypothetical protein
MKHRPDILAKEKDILGWIDEGKTKGFICQELKCRHETLNIYLEIMGIEYEGQKGLGAGGQHLRKPSEYYLKENGPRIHSHELKLKLLEDGLKEYKCENCNLSKWLGKPIPLELHHINGNRYDNREENLQILCPNCHAMTKNHTARNIRRFFCVECGKEISRGSLNSLCKSCVKYGKRRQVERPPLDELLRLVEEYSYLEVGRMFGVSDNAIRKWIKQETKRSELSYNKF